METNTEADSTDITEHPHDDKSIPYVCTVCVKLFTTKRGMMEHRKGHTGENVYSCTQCEKRFSCTTALCRHRNIHTGKYKCTECDKCCQSDAKLAIHKRSHSGVKPFERTVCSKRFKQAGHLPAHSRIHSGEKPYKWHMCDKAFSESGHLNRHMRVHTGDKLYKCSLCNRSFSHSSDLQRHKPCVHSNRRPYHCPYCGKLLRQTLDCRFMFVFTLVQSRTHVDTVHNFLHGINNSRHICWSHTMKVLGWHVTFVNKSSARVVTLTNIYIDMNVWSRMLAVNIQSVSTQQMNWNLIMMTSQDRICVPCVTNGLHRNATWLNTEKNTLEKTCIHVLSVKNVFHVPLLYVAIRIFTQVNTSVQNVTNVVRVMLN